MLEFVVAPATAKLKDNVSDVLYLAIKNPIQFVAPSVV